MNSARQKLLEKPHPPAKPTTQKPSSSNLPGKSVIKECIVEKVAIDPLTECIAELAGAWDDKHSEDIVIEYDISSHTRSPEASLFGNESHEEQDVIYFEHDLTNFDPSSGARSPEYSSSVNEPSEDVMDWESTARVIPVDTVKSIQCDPNVNTQGPAKKPCLIMPASLARQGKVDSIDGTSANKVDDGELANVHRIPMSRHRQLIKAREEALEKISSYLWNL